MHSIKKFNYLCYHYENIIYITILLCFFFIGFLTLAFSAGRFDIGFVFEKDGLISIDSL